MARSARFSLWYPSMVMVRIRFGPKIFRIPSENTVFPLPESPAMPMTKGVSSLVSLDCKSEHDTMAAGLGVEPRILRSKV